jgi:hypothetical protein
MWLKALPGWGSKYSWGSAALAYLYRQVRVNRDFFRDFYFHAPGSLVVLSFPQPLNFSSVLSKTLSETVTSAGMAGCPTVEHL